MSNTPHLKVHQSPKAARGEPVSLDLTNRLIAYRTFFEEAQRLLHKCHRYMDPLSEPVPIHVSFYGGYHYETLDLSRDDLFFIKMAHKEFLKIANDNPALSPIIDIHSEFPYKISFNL